MTLHLHPFSGLGLGHYGAILADPPMRFQTYSRATSIYSVTRNGKKPTAHYKTMSFEELAALPVGDLAAKDCALFLWANWPMIEQSLALIKVWGFRYKTAGFDWMKRRKAEPIPIMGCGFWSRSNTEIVLLATRGHPKRLHADVPMAIFEPRREHSRKPDIYNRIERLVAGPYCELFSRQTPPDGWDSCGNEKTKFDHRDPLAETFPKEAL